MMQQCSHNTIKGVRWTVFGIIRRVDCWIHTISLAIFRLACIACLLIAVVIVAEIGNRNLGLGFMPFALQLSRCAVAFIIFLAAGYTLSVGGHIRVSIIYQRFPEKPRLILDILAYVIILAVCALILIIFFSYWLESLTMGMVLFGIPEIPLWIPQTFVLVGVSILELEAIRGLVKTIWTLNQGRLARTIQEEAVPPNKT